MDFIDSGKNLAFCRLVICIISVAATVYVGIHFNAKIQFNINVSKAGTLQLFYSMTKDMTEQDSRRVELKPGEQTITLSFRQFRRKIHYLRLDPINIPDADIKIGQVVYYSGTHRYTIPFSKIQMRRVSGLIPNEDGYRSTDYDPQWIWMIRKMKKDASKSFYIDAAVLIGSSLVGLLAGLILSIVLSNFLKNVKSHDNGEQINVHQHFDDFICEWKNKLIENRFFLLYGLFWCIISFGFELFQYTESIDDEVFQLPNSFRFWAIQGRFTYGYVLQCFFGSLSVPFFALFFSQLCMLCTYIFAFTDQKRIKDPLHYIAMPLFLSAPILFYGYAFNILTPIIGFGFLFSIFSVLSFKKKCWWSVLLGLLCGVISIGCYQIFFPVILLFLLFNLIGKLEEAASFKIFVKDALQHMFFALGCYGCYIVTLKIILYCSQQQMSSYITNMVALNAPLEVFISNGKTILRNIWQIYSGSPNIYSERISFLLPLTALLVVLLLWNRFVKNINSPLWKKWLYIILLAAIALTPFLFFFMGIARLLIRCRTAMGAALILPFLFVETWKVVKTRVHFVLVVLAVLCLLQFLYVNSKFSYICYLRERQDDHVTQYILNQLLPENHQWPHKSVYVYFQGHLPIPQIPGQFIGGKPIDENTAVSIFNDGFNRFHNLLKKKLYSNMEAMPPQLFPMIEDELLKMPCYPLKGFAKFVNGIAVVKMGQNIPNEVRSYSKFKCIITEKENADVCYLTSPNDSQIGKKIWQGNNRTLNTCDGTIINFTDDSRFVSNVIGGISGIQFKGFPKKLPKNICLRIKYSSPIVEALQIYFYTDKHAQDLQNGHVYLSGLAGEHDIAIVMPSEILKHQYFRLNPGSFNSRIVFEDISIHEYHISKGKKDADADL